MPRIRTIKPGFWTDEKLAQITREARLFFVGMWSVADDQGVAPGNPVFLKNSIFPYDDDLKLPTVRSWLDYFERSGRIIQYEAENGEKYYFIPHFKDHQKIDHPATTLFNPPPREGFAKIAREAREESARGSLSLRPSGEGNGLEGIGLDWNGKDRTVCESEALANPSDSLECVSSNGFSKEILDNLNIKVKTYRPNHKNGNHKRDLKTITLMLTKDKRDPQRTLELIAWYPIGEQYIPEIFSATSLREKYEKLESAFMRSKRASEPKKNSTLASILEVRKERIENGDEG